jgi:hypothetical protein
MNDVPDPVNDFVQDVGAEHVDQKGSDPGGHPSEDEFPEPPVLEFDVENIPERNSIIEAESL